MMLREAQQSHQMRHVLTPRRSGRSEKPTVTSSLTMLPPTPRGPPGSPTASSSPPPTSSTSFNRVKGKTPQMMRPSPPKAGGGQEKGKGWKKLKVSVNMSERLAAGSSGFQRRRDMEREQRKYGTALSA